MDSFPNSDLCLYQVSFVDGDSSPLLYAFPMYVGDDKIYSRIVEAHPDRKIKSIVFAVEGVLLCGSIVDFE